MFMYCSDKSTRSIGSYSARTFSLSPPSETTYHKVIITEDTSWLPASLRKHKQGDVRETDLEKYCEKRIN